jgi:hypothetical protein
MSNADALRRDTARDAETSGHLVESLGAAALFGVAAVTQFSIAAGEALAYLAIVCWLALIAVRRERFDPPPFFWLLAAYAAWTLASAVFSINPRASLLDCKQLSLFLLVPAAYRLMRGPRSSVLLTVVMSAGAVAAAVGIFQYGLLHYDQLNQRPRVPCGR